MKHLIAFAIVGSASAACTSDSVLPFTVMDSATMVRTSRGITNIVLTDFTNSCSIADERDRPSSHTFTFLLADLDADAPPSQPGTYPVFSLDAFPATGLAAECELTAFDATCQQTALTMCSEGTVTLTRVDSMQGYAGTYDVTLDGNHLAGTFDSPSCPDVSETGFGTCS